MNPITEHRFLLFSRLTLIFSLLVILAGSLVKATGAGMGCPDWPKCYGYWIPPMEEGKVQWQAGKDFQKGAIIVYENHLLVAKEDFKTSDVFDAGQWDLYKKHDYAVYKSEHTVIEYVNRLCGAVLGVMVLLMLFFAFPYRKVQPLVFWGTLFSLVLILIEGYLGAMVVESNLKPIKISIHLHTAFLILMAVIYTRSKVVNAIVVESAVYKSVKKYLLISIVLLLVQLFLGSLVRQEFDDFRLAQYLRESWVDTSVWRFLTHRSFSLLYAAVTGVALYQLYEAKVKIFAAKAVLVLIVLNILSGVVMGYFEVPQVVQPLHLMLASLLLSYSCFLLYGLKEKEV